MSDLLAEVRDIASTKLNLVSVKNAKYWSQTPNVLSRKINEIKDSLRAIGIEIDRVSGDTSERNYTIKNRNTFSLKSLQKYRLARLL
jgi:hypothetical protein